MAQRSLALLLLGAASWLGCSSAVPATSTFCSDTQPCLGAQRCEKGICVPGGTGGNGTGGNGMGGNGTGGNGTGGNGMGGTGMGGTGMGGTGGSPGCVNANECANDRKCENGVCVPFPPDETDPQCLRGDVIGTFAPSVHCQWTAPPAGDPFPDHKNVLATPMVVDFDLDNDPASKRPSVVFVTYNGNDGDLPACGVDPSGTYFGVIRVIDGGDCHQIATFAAPRLVPSASVALGDVSGDGRADIVANTIGGGVAAFGWSGAGFSLLWELRGNQIPGMLTSWGGECLWNGPSIHDLDDDGRPEIITNGVVVSSTGQVLDTNAAIVPSAIPSTEYDTTGLEPVVADLDGDGKPEMTDGRTLWEWNAGHFTPVAMNLGARGQVAVADFGTYGASAAADNPMVKDGIAEIVVIAGHQVRVMTLSGRVIFGPLPLPAATPVAFGGPPTIGDFDGDGRPELAVASRGAYTVYDLDCTGPSTPERCPSGRMDGILWSKEAKDVTSSATGSSIFDFDANGTAEAVYADECFTRVYDGPTGDVVYSQSRTSCTWYENPVIADTNANGKAKIVVGSNANTAGCQFQCPDVDPVFDGIRCFDRGDCPPGVPCTQGRCRCQTDSQCGAGFVCRDPAAGPSPQGKTCRAAHEAQTQQGVRILRDRLDRWAPSRIIWNQHAYSVTNVSEGGIIPRTSMWQRNWTSPALNNFRQNVQGAIPPPTMEPDATARDVTAQCPTSMPFVRLGVTACNRGLLPLPAGTPVTFYEGVPPTRAVCTTRTMFEIRPGACIPVTCNWMNAPQNVRLDVTARINDDGTGAVTSAECHQGNNFAEGISLLCEVVPG